MDNANKTMHTTQKTYAAARATVDVLAADWTARVKAELGDRDDDEALYRYDEIGDEIGLPAARRALTAAEDALIAWGLDRAAGIADGANGTAIAALRSGVRRNATVRRKAIDLCFRLAT